MAGTDYRTASGTVNATIAANAGNTDDNRVHVNGPVDFRDEWPFHSRSGKTQHGEK